MIAKGTYVNLDAHGVCRVDDIRFMQFDKSTNGNYYVLHPVYQTDLTIYLPAEGAAPLPGVRPVLSSEEIDRILCSVGDQELPWNPDRKERSHQFHSILQRRDARELLLLIRCIYLRARDHPKGCTTGDLDAMKQAEKMIEQEFSFSLHLRAQDMKQYIQEKLESVQKSDTAMGGTTYEAHSGRLPAANHPLSAERRPGA